MRSRPRALHVTPASERGSPFSKNPSALAGGFFGIILLLVIYTIEPNLIKILYATNRIAKMTIMIARHAC